MSFTYDENFFNGITDKSYISWKKIFQILFQYFSPQSLLDVGGGYGSWSKAFYDLTGSKNYTLLDGEYVHRDKIIVDKDNFVSLDLSAWFSFNKKYDLTICMEVAEHLPEKSSDFLVQSLVRHSDIILFSAALPGQWWTHHINEQYPVYWADKFAEHDFVCLDFLRTSIWHNSGIEWWYRQNTLLFVRKTAYEHHKYDELSKIIPTIPRTIIHPTAWKKRRWALLFNKLKRLFHIC